MYKEQYFNPAGSTSLAYLHRDISHPGVKKITERRQPKNNKYKNDE